MPLQHHRRSSGQRRTIRVFVAAWLLWGIVLAGIRVFHPDLNIGYPIADAHILTASDWYAKNGYRETLGIPVLFTARRPDGSWDLYNSYPPGNFWFHELRRAAGIEALWAHRIVTTIWNHAAVLILFLLIRRFTADALIAAVGAGMYMFSVPYAAGAGGLWEHAEMLGLFATLLAWFRFERAVGRGARRAWFVAAAALFTLDSFLTIQHAVMIGLIVAARAAWMAWRIRRRRPGRGAMHPLMPLAAAAALLAIPPAVLGVRFAAQAYVMGAADKALAYFTNRVEDRMGSIETDQIPAVWSVVGTRIGLLPGMAPGPRELQGWFPVFGHVPLACASIILVAAWPVRRSPRLRAHRRASILGVGLLLSSLSWPIIFPDHTARHPFTTLLFMPSAAVLAAAVATLPLAIGRAAAAGGQPCRRWAAPLLWGASLAIIVVPMRSLRTSQVLNAVVGLDAQVHSSVLEKGARLKALRAARSPVSTASEVEIDYTPVVAQALGLPFSVDLGEARSLDENPGLLLAMDVGTPRGAKRVLSRVHIRGHPRFLADPGSVVFYGHGIAPPFEATVSATIGARRDQLTLRSLAFAPTVGAAAWKCSLLFSAYGSARAQLVAASTRVRVAVLAAEGAEIAAAESGLADHSITSGRNMLAWIQLGREGCESWDHLLVTITSRDHAGEIITFGPVRIDRHARAETTSPGAVSLPVPR